MEHEFFHAEGKTDMKTLRVTFPNFSKARKRVPVNNDHTAKIKKINIYLKKKAKTNSEHLNITKYTKVSKTTFQG